MAKFSLFKSKSDKRLAMQKKESKRLEREASGNRRLDDLEIQSLQNDNVLEQKRKKGGRPQLLSKLSSRSRKGILPLPEDDHLDSDDE
mmetsp:Transcript_14281/g.23322  ORF Transcript_14281/g.23322 Transcript_14281/m.23322 type:complete len:88 (-) Transcript_14281:1076-1339(-)|eukprot:CAMPEP_0203748524 /NCGR_PEP_ID=MMETSP0098-20131031/3389_1 /ASSEMBLY_ACC=CAM_ASM_000208 /TAXON_ID=96639 /ORGANISM=" , Strain NY0313808BC1" /LENGTH=87 /DNA_ID=CAMNT_0050637299 /DNA_START=1031 /DNA_END=1294 /DNA_ORIENTATION=-